MSNLNINKETLLQVANTVQNEIQDFSPTSNNEQIWTTIEEELLKKFQTESVRVAFRNLCELNNVYRSNIISRLEEYSSVTVRLSEMVGNNHRNNFVLGSSKEESNNNDNFNEITDNIEEVDEELFLLAVILKYHDEVGTNVHQVVTNRSNNEEHMNENQLNIRNIIFNNSNDNPTNQSSIINTSSYGLNENVTTISSDNANNIISIKIVSNNNAREIVRRIVDDSTRNRLRMTVINQSGPRNVNPKMLEFNGRTMEEILNKVFEDECNNENYIERGNENEENIENTNRTANQEESNSENNVVNVNEIENLDNNHIINNANNENNWYFSQENSRKRRYTMTNVYVKQPKRFCVREEEFDWTSMLMIPGCHFHKPRVLQVPNTNKILIPTFNQGQHCGYAMKEFTSREEVEDIQLENKFADSTEFMNDLILKAVEFPGLGYEMIFENNERKPIFLPENMKFMEWSDPDVAKWYDWGMMDTYGAEEDFSDSDYFSGGGGGVAYAEDEDDDDEDFNEEYEVEDEDYDDEEDEEEGEF